MYATTGLTKVQTALLIEILIDAINTNKTTPPRHDTLTIFNQIVVTLTYLRRNRTQEDIAATHGVSQPTASRVVTEWTRIIGIALQDWIPTADDLPEGTSWLVDGTLVPCWSWADHPEDWPGKHKTTGRNLIVVTDFTGRIAWISDAYPGSTHDLTAIRDSHILELLNTCWIADKGFIGEICIITLVRKLPHQEHLPPGDVEYNRQVSSLRAPIERANAQLKTWRILQTDYRRPHNTHPETITAVIGHEFFKMSHE